MPTKVTCGNWQKKFLWYPTDIQYCDINIKSKFRWFITVYIRLIQIEYLDGDIFTVYEYAESLLDIIKRDYEKAS
jgi:hypothetical protein